MLAAALAAAQSSTGEPVRVEFRIFDGTAEITSAAKIRVRHSGRSESGTVLESGNLSVDLQPGIYDAQVVRRQPGATRAIRLAEHLVVMGYPDEAGRHLEVINFADGFGALQLRSANAATLAGAVVTVFRLGDTHPAPSRPIRATGYLLLVLPADTYDVRIAAPGRQSIMFNGVDIPAGSTRMKLIQ